ncbi:hypothetical protein GCM10009529_08910 [Micropruina glycogenica]
MQRFHVVEVVEPGCAHPGVVGGPRRGHLGVHPKHVIRHRRRPAERIGQRRQPHVGHVAADLVPGDLGRAARDGRFEQRQRELVPRLAGHPGAIDPTAAQVDIDLGERGAHQSSVLDGDERLLGPAVQGFEFEAQLSALGADVAGARSHVRLLCRDQVE